MDRSSSTIIKSPFRWLCNSLLNQTNHSRDPNSHRIQPARLQHHQGHQNCRHVQRSCQFRKNSNHRSLLSLLQRLYKLHGLPQTAHHIKIVRFPNIVITNNLSDTTILNHFISNRYKSKQKNKKQI